MARSAQPCAQQARKRSRPLLLPERSPLSSARARRLQQQKGEGSQQHISSARQHGATSSDQGSTRGCPGACRSCGPLPPPPPHATDVVSWERPAGCRPLHSDLRACWKG